ncbi:sugar ABC transporter ATP-binding protein [Pseudorhodoplanes sp.]|uniref:sugar ABC transporter ATP-binding protein n=1 Tax=Pseudorhodoplanes sp. TaxID=1934341 RepID=UPI002C5C4618|nr:sugar ABC transporter ATP-binding protein [Pseudorhodoplanes sp.]HWV41179.1 sugar ABC transporter ATP-binding protein [Pseudorhodoplanes sp.]
MNAPADRSASVSGNAITVSGLSKSFGATRALHSVDFSVDFGETHALVGENGAGKSTLIRILGGVHRADSGAISIAGREHSFGSPHEAILAGVVTIPQELRMVPALSIAENIALGNPPTRALFGLLPVIDRRRMREEAQHYLQQLNFSADLDRPVHSLSFAERQLVAIAKALRLKCRIFILDEPTAALEDREIERLFAVIARMKAQGTAIIYISHRLDEIVTLADRCTVLRDGKCVATRVRGRFTTADLIEDMTGKMAEEVAAEPLEPGQPLLEEIDDRTDRMTVRRNEAIGLAGLLGSGSDRIVRRLFGITGERPQIRIAGDSVRRFALPADAIRSDIGFVPGDRSLGLVMNLSVRDNILLPSLTRDNSPLWINRKAGDVVVRELMELLDVRPRRPDLRVGSLSGGNQQKVIIAKWLARRVTTLLLDEPTHGIDIAAKMHVHALIRQFTRDGGGVIVSSSDIPELARICDTVLSVKNRRIVSRIDRREGIDESRLRASLGGTH